ncbi:DNA/RNA non-specific endonuclease [Sinorhizobium meliloti]|uniref:DNA/RNA non-specific endonuclease n=1 Tax=Rhizobium meliloti TaxID=382 RepID=UPI0009B786E5|nr:DNA/RNA non-specific endonuclease [Sinorhizobium meliloti]MDE4618397.1 DNA/RNA non-specific endonuclease [Sinorhizobium meliloti]
MRVFRSFGPPSDFEQARVSEELLPLESYNGRSGYDPGFVDPRQPLSLPGPGRWGDDLIELRSDARVSGQDPFELKYTHFSVKMAKSRALPLFSACNIEGSQSDRDVERTDVWRRDPRIENRYQNLREGYGNENQGFFSRGHMTRREDPNWGNDATAKTADADTFHITNVAPQRQGFNAGIWLDLENYVLNNADRENLKVTVITGPILSEDDPTYYNREIPVAFWKIIAFIDGQTNELTTIGYKRSQLTYLPRRTRSRFVFGDFEDTQVPIASLQEETGLDLDDYVQFDAMAGAGSGFEVRVSSVSDFYLRR